MSNDSNLWGETLLGIIHLVESGDRISSLMPKTGMVDRFYPVSQVLACVLHV